MAGKITNSKAVSLDDKKKQYRKIGKHLKQLRKDAGFRGSLRFALEIGIHPAQYARYEAGTDMKVSSLIRVLSFHNLTLQEFFAGME